MPEGYCVEEREEVLGDRDPLDLFRAVPQGALS